MSSESLYKPKEAAAPLPSHKPPAKAAVSDCGSKPPMECERMKNEEAARLHGKQVGGHHGGHHTHHDSAGQEGAAENRFGHDFGRVRVHDHAREKKAASGKKEEAR